MMANDREALVELAKVSRIQIEHTIVHYLYFPTPRRAQEVMQILIAAGHETEEPHPVFDRSWGLLVRARMVPQEDEIVAMRRLLTKLANEFNGDYDGWDAEVVPFETEK